MVILSRGLLAVVLAAGGYAYVTNSRSRTARAIAASVELASGAIDVQLDARRRGDLGRRRADAEPHAVYVARAPHGRGRPLRRVRVTAEGYAPFTR